MYTVKICHYDWFNKQADWPIAEQDKVRRESQTENDGMRKGEVGGATNQTHSKWGTQNGIEVKATNLWGAHRLIEMG